MVKTNEVSRDIGKVLNGIAKTYRKGTDWAKPYVDFVIDPATFFLGSNALLSTGIYYANKLAVQPGMDKVFGEGNTEDFFNSYSTLEALTKIGIYGTIYGVEIGRAHV